MIETYLLSLTTPQILFFIFIENILILLLSIVTAESFSFYFRARMALPSRKIMTKEITLAALCVFNNCVVTVIGFYLWKNNVIHIKGSTAWSVDLFYFALLFFIMDFAMYVSHRIAHIKFIYPYVHKTHHQFIEVRPLTLFALNPIETLGFGGLWLVVLYFVSPTWPALFCYLIVNVMFGSLGHMPVEPLPKSWGRIPFLNQLTTRTFHALHHQNKENNYGFYTVIWDHIGRSLSPNYKTLFEEATNDKE